MRKFFIFLIMGILVNLLGSEINWAKDFHEGMKSAEASSKPILFVSSNHACKYCVVLDETTFKDKRVIEELNKNFVSIIAYSDDNDYMPKELWQPGTPAIWFIDAVEGPMFQPLMGAVDAENLLLFLGLVKEKFNEMNGKNR